MQQFYDGFSKTVLKGCHSKTVLSHSHSLNFCIFFTFKYFVSPPHSLTLRPVSLRLPPLGFIVPLQRHERDQGHLSINALHKVAVDILTTMVIPVEPSDRNSLVKSASTSLVKGLVFDKKVSHAAGGPTRMENAKIAVIQFQISPPKTDIEQSIVVSDYSQMDRILKEERSYILGMIKKIKATGCNVLLIQKSILRDAVTDLTARCKNHS